MDFFIANAQDLYTSAYDLYGAGAFAQASRTAQAALALARVAGLLMADDFGPGSGVMAGFGHFRRLGMRPHPGLLGLEDDAPDMDDDEPVTVPAPEF